MAHPVLRNSPSPTTRILDILSRCPVFQTAPTADLERLAARCVYQQHRRGSEILRHGEDGHSLVVVGRGRIKGMLPSPGGDHEMIVGLFWPGDVFGEPSVFEHRPRTGTATAVSETEVVLIPRVELLALLERRPAVALRLIAALCDKFRVALEFTLCLRYLDIPSRLYKRLLYLRPRDGREEADGSVRIHHGLSQGELASSIGASREALNKLLAEWRKAGAVDSGRGYVVVRSFEMLSQLLPCTSRSPSVGASFPLLDLLDG